LINRPQGIAIMKLRQIPGGAPQKFIDLDTMPTDLAKQLPMLAGDMSDLGFENLGLTPDQQRRLHDAFRQNGVRIPGSAYKIKDGSPMAIEPHTNVEPPLPDHWLRGAWVLQGGIYRWIGSAVRIGDQISSDFDFTPYTKLGDGWMLTTAIA
jgi:hypothetical protein